MTEEMRNPIALLGAYIVLTFMAFAYHDIFPPIKDKEEVDIIV